MRRLPSARGTGKATVRRICRPTEPGVISALCHHTVRGLERLKIRKPPMPLVSRLPDLFQILYDCSLYTEEAQNLRLRVTLVSPEEARTFSSSDSAPSQSRYTAFA